MNFLDNNVFAPQSKWGGKNKLTLTLHGVDTRWRANDEATSGDGAGPDTAVVYIAMYIYMS